VDVPTPHPGQVIRYEYLWKREADRGAEDGRKERPCALLLSQQTRDGRTEVFVLPITHSPPTEPAFAIEIPQAVKRRLKLDDERSWIILSELNRTPWPNQDTRVVPGSKPETIGPADEAQLLRPCDERCRACARRTPRPCCRATR